jgi:beta-lactamase class A
MFHRDFLAQVPPAQVTAILQQYHAQGGAVTGVTPTSTRGDYYGEYRFTTESGASYSVKIGVDSKSPHLVNTLWFGLVEPGMRSPEEALTALGKLSGRVSFAFCRLGDGSLELLHGLEPDLHLAIGSTFKLYILGAVARGVNEGRFAFDEVTRLREDRLSWPSGILQEWPVGSPLTVHTLAGLMISISDNSATDHLLFLAGRREVEKILPEMGHTAVELDMPFLATAEMFRLKELGHADARVAAYVSLAEQDKRDYLERELSQLERAEFAGIDQVSPTAVDRVEWFASALDLCRAVDWLRAQTALGKPAAPVRDILAINPGLDFDDEVWSYVGYKGGSEPGVLNLTWLLQHANGTWFALSAGWNDTEAGLDKKELYPLLRGFVGLVGREFQE